MVVLRTASNRQAWVGDAIRVLKDFGIPFRIVKGRPSSLEWDGIRLIVPLSKAELTKAQGLCVAVNNGTNAALWFAAILAPAKVRAYRKAQTAAVMRARTVI